MKAPQPAKGGDHHGPHLGQPLRLRGPVGLAALVVRFLSGQNVVQRGQRGAAPQVQVVRVIVRPHHGLQVIPDNGEADPYRLLHALPLRGPDLGGLLLQQNGDDGHHAAVHEGAGGGGRG